MKLFLDQNLSFRIPPVIKAFYEWEHPNLEFIHLTERYDIGFNKGVDDLVWISDLSTQGGWIIFTVDRGKSSSIQPLPQICSRLKVTHVLIGESLANPSKLKQALVECWEQLRWLADQSPGTRARIREERNSKGIAKFILHEVEITKVFDKQSRKVVEKRRERKAPKPKKTASKKRLSLMDHQDFFRGGSLNVPRPSGSN